MVPKTPANILYRNNCLDMLVIMLPDKTAVKKFARTSTPKKNRIEMILRKVVSKTGAQSSFEKSRSKHDGFERLVNTILKTVLTTLSNNRFRKKQYPEARQRLRVKLLSITPLKIAIEAKACRNTHQIKYHTKKLPETPSEKCHGKITELKCLSNK